MAEKLMERAEWELLCAHTIHGHVQKLRELVADNLITEEDHDRCGYMMQKNIAHLISLSDAAWDAFKVMVDESRRVQRIPHEPHPDDVR